MYQKIVFFPKPKVDSIVIEFQPVVRKDVNFEINKIIRIYY